MTRPTDILLHLTDSEAGLEVLVTPCKRGYAVIFRDTDAEQLIERREGPSQTWALSLAQRLINEKIRKETLC